MKRKKQRTKWNPTYSSSKVIAAIKNFDMKRIAKRGM